MWKEVGLAHHKVICWKLLPHSDLHFHDFAPHLHFLVSANETWTPYLPPRLNQGLRLFEPSCSVTWQPAAFQHILRTLRGKRSQFSTKYKAVSGEHLDQAIPFPSDEHYHRAIFRTSVLKSSLTFDSLHPLENWSTTCLLWKFRNFLNFQPEFIHHQPTLISSSLSIGFCPLKIFIGSNHPLGAFILLDWINYCF